ncbi:DUF4134 domain-containing protein [Pedobacter frigiditerrae]|uniref:DUF4134 domain-containing protein n=1 Tax=Pedobacter frigiditerrae TaxID=2530452 RepID=A0A4R0MPK9_9SPHI|nr:DUF4134 domain-containing protein [Pedobacter frigiditerrae]
MAKPQNKRDYCRILSFVGFKCVSTVFLLGLGMTAWAQDGNAGIQEATNKVKGYFDTGCDLMYAIGAVVGIIGAVKVLCAMN